MSAPKMFPLQTDRHAPAGPTQIPWSVAEIAYGEYARQYGRSQSLERLAERGGFGWGEMDSLHPKWREEVSELAALRAERDKLLAFKAYVHKRLDDAGIAPDPDSAHKAHGCRMGGRLDLLLSFRSEYRVFLAMLSRAGIGHGLRDDRDPPGATVQVEEDSGKMITEFAFDDSGRLLTTYCYEPEAG